MIKTRLLNFYQVKFVLENFYNDLLFSFIDLIYSIYESGIVYSQTLKIIIFRNIDIHKIINYLETLEYDLQKTKYTDQIISKNERLAKYFLRGKLKI